MSSTALSEYLGSLVTVRRMCPNCCVPVEVKYKTVQVQCDDLCSGKNIHIYPDLNGLESV